MSSFSASLPTLDGDWVSLQKKLQNSWSSWSASRTLSPALLEDMAAHFDKLDSKVKMRCLISLIGLDLKKRTEFMKQIKNLLRVACDDSSSDAWVGITAGLVNERLFGDDALSAEATPVAPSVSAAAKKALRSSSDQVVERLLSHAATHTHGRSSSAHGASNFDVDAELEALYSFQPLECVYGVGVGARAPGVRVPSSAPSTGKAATSQNPHFSCPVAAPAILATVKSLEPKNVPPTLPASMSSFGSAKPRQALTVVASAAAAAAADARKQQTPSFLLQRSSAHPTSRAPAKVMDMADLKASVLPVVSAKQLREKEKERKDQEKEKERERKEQEKEAKKAEKEAEKEKEKAAKKEAAAAVKATAAKTAAAVAATAATESPAKATTPQQTPTPTTAVDDEPLAGETGQKRPLSPAGAPEGAKPKYAFPADLPLLYRDYPAVSTGDREVIAQFFSEPWRETIVDAQTRAAYQVLLKEEVMLKEDDGEVAGKAVHYLILNYQSQSWEVLQRFKAKKPKRDKV